MYQQFVQLHLKLFCFNYYILNISLPLLSGLITVPRTKVLAVLPVSSNDATKSSNTFAVSLASNYK